MLADGRLALARRYFEDREPEHVAVPADGVHLPEVLQGRDWTWIDRTPGRSSEASAKTVEVPQDGVITWPDGPYGARIIELVRH